MKLTIELTGLNLEKLLTLAAQEGVVVYSARRTQPRTMRIVIRSDQKKALSALCERFGWEMRVVSLGALAGAMKRIGQRPMLPAAAALCIALVMLSSNMIWRIEIEHAGKNIGEVRTFLQEAGIGPGRLKAGISLSQLRETLLLRLPDLAYAGAAYEGSTLVIDCRAALEGERALTGGSTLDLVAAQDGVVTGLVVHSGTPLVQIGQAVCAGDVLIRGEERGEKQTVHPVAAQGTVTARVWARGDARVSRYAQRTVETGAVRQRVTLHTPWHSRVVREAEPFAAQDVSVSVEPVVGLYLPLWREIETYAEIVVIREKRSEGDAASMAQAAAQQMAKKMCPADTLILDKTTEYSMIDTEYVYATVVLEYERNIAVRADGTEFDW